MQQHRTLPQRVAYRIVKALLHLAAVVAYGLRVSGQRYVPMEGGLLVVSNHQSHFDPPLVGVAAPRMLSFLARHTLFVSWFGRLIAYMGAFPIDREGSGLSGVKETLLRLKGGEAVLMFPEGTRTPDGEVGPIRPGFITLAVRSKAAILPAAIEGAFDAWPRQQMLPGCGTIHIRFGPPITPEEVARLSEEELAAEVDRRIRTCHTALRRHPIFQRKGKRRRT